MYVLLKTMGLVQTTSFTPSSLTDYTCIRYVPFRDQRILLFVKSIKTNRPLSPSLPLQLDEATLFSIISAGDSLPFPEN